MTVYRSTAPPPQPSWPTPVRFPSGMALIIEESHELPLVDVEIVLRTGTIFDPPGKEGLSRLALRMLRMGTRALSANDVDDAIDGMGATLVTDVAHGSLRLRGSVIRRSLPQYLALLGKLLTRPALRSGDLALLVRETVAEIGAARDSDRWLAGRALRTHLFGEHPYARSTTGSERSVKSITRADVQAHLATHLVTGNMVVAVAGDVEAAEALRLVETSFRKVPEGPSPELDLAVPTLDKGRRLILVDKPERTQAQLYLGTLGTRLADPLFYPLLVANTAFGGTFTSRLTKDIRSERGYSYSVSSRLGADRQREIWSVYSHPAIENLEACLGRELELVQGFVEEGVTNEEARFAGGYLIKSHAFERDTASKRLEPRVEAEASSLDPTFWSEYLDHVRSVTVPRANDAVRARLSHEDLAIAIVATRDQVEDLLGRTPGLRSLDVVSYRDV